MLGSCVGTVNGATVFPEKVEFAPGEAAAMRGFDKLMVFFGLVLIGIVVLVFFSNPTQFSRNISSAELVEGIKFLNEAARAPCTRAIREHLQRDLGDPSDAVSDGRTIANLTWQPDASKASTVVCYYEVGIGVTKLTVGDRVLFAAD